VSASQASVEGPRRHQYWCALRWSDMDAYGHVNNVAFLTYLEEARVDMLFVHAAGATEKLASGVVVARHEIDYKLPLVFRPDPVLIETWVTNLGHASFTLRYEIREQPYGAGDEVVYAVASTVMVPFDIAAGRPRRVTDEERGALAPFVAASG
jgi:acyl-CoA thioester hydrolase